MGKYGTWNFTLMIMFEFIFTFFSILAEGTNCADAEYSLTNDRFKNLWLNSEVYYSYDACNNSKRDSKFLWTIYCSESIKFDNVPQWWVELVVS